MFIEKTYVRCPADRESATDPRVFVCGQIVKVDEFGQTLSVKIHDPFSCLDFFDDLPRGIIKVPMSRATHCKMFAGSNVFARRETCKVLSAHLTKEGLYWYYVQSLQTKDVFKADERTIIAPFNNGAIDPARQLVNYEFQNPCWYLGHAVVSRSVNVLENSMYGFKELAGSKIYLLAHQVNSIMRCLQEKPCRYMLADEVGMGKTVEAISIVKIYMHGRAGANILFIVPKTLKAQWDTELLLKFGISAGIDKDENRVVIKTFDELDYTDIALAWDFVIIDEVHRYLSKRLVYDVLHGISKAAKNILLLSATPVQQRKEEYLSLLRLLEPRKYDSCTLERFGALVEKQGGIIQKTALILDDLADYEGEINAARERGDDAHASDDCKDMFEEIHDDLEEICGELRDDKLSALLDNVSFDGDDLGVYQMKVIISYICGNYQIESNVIRNRRKILETNDDGVRLLPTRLLEDVSYPLDPERNAYEYGCYRLIADWLTERGSGIDVEKTVKPLLGAFFSSPGAFFAELCRQVKAGVKLRSELIGNAESWRDYENGVLKDIVKILDDPGAYEDDCATRLVTVMNLLREELYEQKTVLFTNYAETFAAYRAALERVFTLDEVSFFGEGLPVDEIELNAYRFQNDSECRIMLCDYTGGEGRNFQCADYVVHIDLPWDAGAIEQRIGRLDRLERDPARSVVHSVVVHTEDTFEAALFGFYRDGLKIFTQSLSGMEIIMKDINDEISAAVREDFKYGLSERVSKVVRIAERMREAVRKEQNYDAAGFMFRPMYAELRRLIDYYSRNENELFASAMTEWASLAGFNGAGSRARGVITYSEESFSPQSALNSQLIPPRWSEYIGTRQNRFVGDVQAAYDKRNRNARQARAIRGTFIRKLAIENDYLHFFAPGDDVFDCIVSNAINSCKGCASAFAVPAGFDWCGIVFTWTVAPNEAYLLDKGMSVYALSQYRSYLTSEQVVVPVDIYNFAAVPSEDVVREYTRLINIGFVKNKTVHLGKRGRAPGFLGSAIGERTNLEWFKDSYPGEEWAETVASARKESYAKALEAFKHRSNIRGAKEEMERVLSARCANNEFYGVDDDKLERLKQEQEYILDALRKPVIALDSAAYIWMVKTEDEHSGF